MLYYYPLFRGSHQFIFYLLTSKVTTSMLHMEPCSFNKLPIHHRCPPYLKGGPEQYRHVLTPTILINILQRWFPIFIVCFLLTLIFRCLAMECKSFHHCSHLVLSFITQLHIWKLVKLRSNWFRHFGCFGRRGWHSFFFPLRTRTYSRTCWCPRSIFIDSLQS